MAKNGRPAQFPEWGDRVWDALFAAHPEGMETKDLLQATGLTPRQMHKGIKHLRSIFLKDDAPPVVYVREAIRDRDIVVAGPNKWYVAPAWATHIRPSLSCEFLGQAERRMSTAREILKQAERSFAESPDLARRISEVRRDVASVQQEIAELNALLAN